MHTTSQKQKETKRKSNVNSLFITLFIAQRNDAALGCIDNKMFIVGGKLKNKNAIKHTKYFSISQK